MGIFDGVGEGISANEFFENELPKAFEREMGAVAIEGMDGTLLKVIFDIEGARYGITITDAKDLEISEGGVDDPDIEIKLTEEGWKTAVSGALGNALDMFTDFTKMADRRRYDAVKDINGKLNLTLERPDADAFEVVARFHDADSPEVSITCDIGVWNEIMAGATQAAMAFMGGKLRLTGDTPLAMQLNTLM